MATHRENVGFTPISALGEFGLIDRIRERIGDPRSTSTIRGIGDDAAVMRLPEGAVQVISTDLLVEHVHFDRTYTPMRHLGYKAMTSNISDIVAMFATPDAATISLGISSSISVEMIDSLYDGIVDAGTRYGIDVVGGDISGAHKFVISVTLLGHGYPDKLSYRSGASKSDVICVSGSLGGAYAGLRILQHHKERMLSSGSDYEPDMAEHAFVIQRHLRPEARIDIVESLRAAGVQPTSMIDVSDGLASEIRHLCSQSGCSARIDASNIPIDDRTLAAATFLGDDVFDYALYGGEEYELVFTIRADDVDALRDSGAEVAIIGSCLHAGPEPEILRSDGSLSPLISEGFRHF